MKQVVKKYKKFQKFKIKIQKNQNLKRILEKKILFFDFLKKFSLSLRNLGSACRQGLRSCLCPASVFIAVWRRLWNS